MKNGNEEEAKLYSISIMGHEDRSGFFSYLKEKLSGAFLFVDKGKPGDEENLGIWGNARRSWLAYDKNAEWHFVIQDDSILTEKFHEKLTKLLTNLKEDYVVALYAGENARRIIRIAKKRGKNHFIDGRIFNENALGMRTKHIEEMVAYCDAKNTKLDLEIEQWAKSKRLPIYYPLPSLVDHREDKSIYRYQVNHPGKDRIRKAVWFEK